DDGRPGTKVVVIVVVVVPEHALELDLLLLTGVDEEDLGADLGREQLDHVVAQGGGGGDHLALLEQEADDVGRGAVQLGADVLGCRAALDDDLALRDGRVGPGVGGGGGCLQLLEAATAPTPALGGTAVGTGPAAAAGRTTTGAAAGTTAGAGGAEATGAGAAGAATRAAAGTGTAEAAAGAR